MHQPRDAHPCADRAKNCILAIFARQLLLRCFSIPGGCYLLHPCSGLQTCQISACLQRRIWWVVEFVVIYFCRVCRAKQRAPFVCGALHFIQHTPLADFKSIFYSDPDGWLGMVSFSIYVHECKYCW